MYPAIEKKLKDAIENTQKDSLDDLNPDDWPSPEELNQEKITTGQNWIYLLILAELFHKIPENRITLENISKKESIGSSPIEELCSMGHLNQVNPKILTKEIMLKKDRQKMSPIHRLAFSGHLMQLPEKFRTFECLSQKGAFGNALSAVFKNPGVENPSNNQWARFLSHETLNEIMESPKIPAVIKENLKPVQKIHKQLKKSKSRMSQALKEIETSKQIA